MWCQFVSVGPAPHIYQRGERVRGPVRTIHGRGIAAFRLKINITTGGLAPPPLHPSRSKLGPRGQGWGPIFYSLIACLSLVSVSHVLVYYNLEPHVGFIEHRVPPTRHVELLHAPRLAVEIGPAAQARGDHPLAHQPRRHDELIEGSAG